MITRRNFAAGASAATAATKTLVVDQSDFVAEPAAALKPGDGVVFSESVNPTVGGATLVLPADFARDSVAVLRLTLVNQDATACAVQLVPFATKRTRKGHVVSPQVGSASGLLPAKPGATKLPAMNEMAFTKDFKLRAQIGGTVAGQRAGDIVLVAVMRLPADPADTCSAGAVIVSGMKLIYQTN